MKNFENSSYLVHTGILGMRWGVRRTGLLGTRGIKSDDGPDGPKKAEKKKIELSEDYTNTKRLLTKKVPELSNKELKALNERMQLEVNYANLKPGHVKSGTAMVKNLTAIGTTIASLYALSKTPLGQDVTKIVKGKLAA